jgi:hypothetical protein
MHLVTLIRIAEKNNVSYSERHNADKEVKKGNFLATETH